VLRGIGPTLGSIIKKVFAKRPPLGRRESHGAAGPSETPSPRPRPGRSPGSFADAASGAGAGPAADPAGGAPGGGGTRGGAVAPAAGRKRKPAGEAEACTAAAGDPGAAPPAARRKRAPRAYSTYLGTAPSAILVVLYVAHRQGQEKLTKEEIVSAAEATGIHGRSFRPAPPGHYAGQGPADRASFYSGWSCMKTLLNSTPPVVHKWGRSNFRLTPEGVELAERLHGEAVQLGRVPPLAPPSGAGAATAPAPAPAPPAPPGGARGGLTPLERAELAEVGLLDLGLAHDVAGWDGPDDAVYNEPAMAALGVTRESLARRRGAAGGGRAGDRVICVGDSSDEEPSSLRERLAAGAGGGGGAAGPGSGAGAAAGAAALRRAARHEAGAAVVPGREGERGAAAASLAGGQQSSYRELLDAQEAAAARRAARRGGGAAVHSLPAAALPPTPSPGALARPPGTGLTPMGRGATPGGGPAPGDAPALGPGLAVPSIPLGPALAAGAAAGAAGRGLPPPAAGGGHPSGGGSSQQLNAGPAGGGAGPAPGVATRVIQRQQLAPGGVRGRGEAAPGTVSLGDVFSGWALPSVGGDHPVRLPPLRPGERFRDAYDVVLLVDQREQFAGARDSGQELQRVLGQLSAQGVRCEARRLGSGDDVWVARSRADPSAEYVLDRLVERKAVADLRQSILSGRLDRQKYLMRCTGLPQLYLLVEGDPFALQPPGAAGAAGPGAARRALGEVRRVLQSATNAEILDGFCVVRTRGVADSVRWYAGMTRAVEAAYAERVGGEGGGDAGGLPTLREVEVRLREASTETVGHMWGRVLCQVTGVSLDSASKIMAAFPTPVSLFRAYRDARAAARAAGTVGPDLLHAATAAALPRAARGVRSNVAEKVYGELFRAGFEDA